MPSSSESTLSAEICEDILKACKRHPKPDSSFLYGTAGFRTRADNLDSVMFRMGLLAVLRSKAKHGKAIGVMITASHNPIHDNGVKLIDPMGEMLDPTWEGHASKLANARDDEVCGCLKTIIAEEKISNSHPAQVFVARDTRPSGEEFVKSVEEGVLAIKGKFRSFGLLSTPQLHYIIRCTNTDNAYGQPTEEGYYQKLSEAYRKLRATGTGKAHKILLDAANGVGALKVKRLMEYIGDDVLTIEIFNDGTIGVLNEECGADYVKVHQCAPKGLQGKANESCVSFDGDGDRVLFFFYDEGGNFNLLDGDKIAVLIAAYLKEQLDVANIKLSKGIGVVQTAYSNGSSTEYLEHFMKVPTACVNVGVKHLHKQAEEYDVGVYFEANGHGTVLFSEEAEQKIKHMADKGIGQAKQSASALLAFMDLTNQTVGDAISDMLLVDVILSQRNWTCSDWSKCYQDLPYRQRKVLVKDRTVIKTFDAERKVSHPSALQEEIDKLVSKFPKSRSFVRPSGTEDIVRVYAEAETQEITDHIAASASALVHDLCGGTGPRPEIPVLNQ